MRLIVEENHKTSSRVSNFGNIIVMGNVSALLSAMRSSSAKPEETELMRTATSRTLEKSTWYTDKISRIVDRGVTLDEKILEDEHDT